jgi:hypothetical protein
MSLICPQCQGTKIVLNCKTYYGKQRYKCQKCQRQFVENPRNQPISDDQKQLIDIEKIFQTAICRASGVSKRWLQYYVNQKYYQLEKKANICEKKRGRLTLQLDEMWSYVQTKRQKVWIWIAWLCRNQRNCRFGFGGSQRKNSPNIMGKFAKSLSAVCGVLYRFLVSVSGSFAIKKT